MTDFMAVYSICSTNQKQIEEKREKERERERKRKERERDVRYCVPVRPFVFCLDFLEHALRTRTEFSWINLNYLER